MKKLLIPALILVAIVSFGGNIASVHADTLTPEQAAVLAQSLDAMKEKLMLLQAQAALQAAGPSVASAPVLVSAPVQTATLSAQDAASLNSALTLLAQSLTSLQAEVAANPSLTTGREMAIASALQGIGKTLSLIGTAATGGSVAGASAPIAEASPSAVSVSASVPTSPTVSVTTPSPAADNGSAAVAAADNSQVTTAAPVQTAQALSFWKKLNWPLVIVILLVIAAVALWLFWPSEEEEKVQPVRKNGAPNREQPIVATLAKSGGTISSPTPLSSVMGASMDRQGPSAPKVLPQQQQQQRKPA